MVEVIDRIRYAGGHFVWNRHFYFRANIENQQQFKTFVQRPASNGNINGTDT